MRLAAKAASMALTAAGVGMAMLVVKLVAEVACRAEATVQATEEAMA